MFKRAFHIIVIAVLAMNLTGVLAFAYATDCGMECCKPEEWSGTGTASYESASCCGMDDVSCGFETGQYEELFDEALCCFNGSISKNRAVSNLLATIDGNADIPILRYSVTRHSKGSPQTVPVYLSNATLIC
jgi:hypothetical protein